MSDAEVSRMETDVNLIEIEAKALRSNINMDAENETRENAVL